MNASPLLATLCCLALTAGSCARHAETHPVAGASTLREIDSVISECRELLARNPDEAELHSRLGGALLERVLIQGGRYSGEFWGGFNFYNPLLRDIGRPFDPQAYAGPRDTLRQAEIHSAKARALRPDLPAPLRTLGRIYLTLGERMYADTLIDRGRAFFDSSLAIDTASADAYAGLGKCLLWRHRTTAALAALNTSLRYDSTSGSTFLTLGEAYADTGNVSAAFACYENAAGLGLKTAGEYLRLANHFRDVASEEKLLGRLAFLRMDAPGFLKPTVRAMLRVMHMDHPTIAMDLAGMALEVDPACAEANLVRAWLYLAEGDTVSATGEVRTALENGDAPVGMFESVPPEVLIRVLGQLEESGPRKILLGRSYLRMRQPWSAIPVLRDAAQMMPTSAAAEFTLGAAFLAMRDTAKTIECFDRAMALPAGTYPFTYWSMITFYRDVGQPQKVVLAFQQQIAITGSSWIAVMIENEHTAHTRGAKTVTLAAALCEAGYNYAWAINDNRRGAIRAEAERLFKRAHDVLPESAIPFLGLGDLHFDLGERDEAYRCYRKSAALGSSDAREKIRMMDAGKR